MAKETVNWVCEDCGFVQKKWSGSCSACHKWNTFKEFVEFKEKKRLGGKPPEILSKPIRIHEVDHLGFDRIFTGFSVFDHLMGGGVVKGSLTLLGGIPGIGKSTLLLQICHSFAKQGLTVLYVCGEESVQQTSLRAKRLQITGDKLYLLNETAFSKIKSHIDTLKPDILVLDSAQILYQEEIPSAPGSVVQVKEIAMQAMHLAKGFHITTFLVGHVTKSGDLAGPKVLEHIVDTVLDFEGDHHQGYRLIRASKNRFGPTDELAVFQMLSSGLAEVKNPSLLFLEERRKSTPGSVITATVEGSRAMLLEIQALVTKTFYPSPTRRASGLDMNRLVLLLAVLEKKMRFPLYSYDVFASVVGGIKVQEPALDLALILSITSSYQSLALNDKMIVFGEVGLSGEVRSVSHIESRIKEAKLMGFTGVILPKHNMKEVAKLEKSLTFYPVDRVEEAIEITLGELCKSK